MEAWHKIAASPIGDLASTAAPYAVTAVAWIAGTLRSLGWLLMQFLLTLTIAAVMYAKGEGAADGCLRFGRKLAGEQGDRVVRLAAQAIRGVALGIVVTALVQTALTGVALAIAGVPFAALLSVVTFVSCIAQLGPALVLIPSVAWLYWQGATGTATALLLWSVVVVTARQRPAAVPDDQGRRPADAGDVHRCDRRPARVWPDRTIRRAGGAGRGLHAGRWPGWLKIRTRCLTSDVR